MSFDVFYYESESEFLVDFNLIEEVTSVDIGELKSSKLINNYMVSNFVAIVILIVFLPIFLGLQFIIFSSDPILISPLPLIFALLLNTLLFGGFTENW